MNPHDRLARACGALPPTFRKLRGAAWIAAVLLAWVWMLGNAIARRMAAADTWSPQ